MNLILRTVRLENFMTSCRDKLYHHAISNKIKFNFLIILFGKMSSSKSLPSSSTETESKVAVAYGRNFVSDLASNNDVTTNGVNGRIGYKTW